MPLRETFFQYIFYLSKFCLSAVHKKKTRYKIRSWCKCIRLNLHFIVNIGANLVISAIMNTSFNNFIRLLVRRKNYVTNRHVKRTVIFIRCPIISKPCFLSSAALTNFSDFHDTVSGPEILWTHTRRYTHALNK